MQIYTSQCDHEILYADRASKDGRLLMDHFCGGAEVCKRELKFKIYSFFMVTAHEPLQLDKLNLVPCVVMDISSNFI
jgi:hypothetical protein